MCNWSYLLLAIHFASATFINTDLHAPLAGVVPNQLRIYREYPLQYKDANTKQSESLDEEGQKVLVNCTIRSTNVKDTDKMIKQTTANCTVTHDSIGLERKVEDSLIDEQRVNKMKQGIDEVGDGSAMQYQRADNLPHINVTDDSYVSVNEKPGSQTRKAMDEIDRGNNESEKRIPVVIEPVVSHPQDVSKIGEENFKVAVEKTDHTSEAALLRTSEQEKIIADVATVQQNNEQDKQALEDSVRNANEESLLTLRHANNESTMTKLVNESTQNFNISEQKSSDVSIVASPRMDDTEQKTLKVGDNSISTEIPNETRHALNNTKDPMVRSETDDIQRFLTENAPKPFNQYHPLSNNYNYSFDNSGRRKGKQTPNNINYRAITEIEEPLQRQPENTTTKPTLDYQYENKHSPEKLYSTLAMVTNESLKNQDSRSPKEKSNERSNKEATPKSLAEFTKERIQNASDENKRLASVRTIGSSQVIYDRSGQPQRDVIFPSLIVAVSPLTGTGNGYPIAAQIQTNTINSKHNPSQLNERRKYFNVHTTKPTFTQNLGQETPSYVKDSGLWQEQRFAYIVPQSAAYGQLNQPGGIWDSVNVPHQKTIWDTLNDATNIAHRWLN